MGISSSQGNVSLETGQAGVPPVRAVSCGWDAVDVAASKSFFISDRAYVVKSITARVDVAGVDIGGVTAVIRKVSSGTAVASGTVLHTGSINLKAAASSVVTLTLSATASDLVLAANDALALHVTGTPTTAQGVVTLHMEPA